MSLRYDKDMIHRSNILGVGISVINMELALAQIGSWIDHDDRQYVCVTSAHPISVCQRDERLRCIINQAGMVTPDGMPLVWLSRLQGYRFIERVYGPDLLLAACERSLQMGWTHFFYGGGNGVADKVAERLIERYPGLKVVGMVTPPFRPLTQEENETIVAAINSASPDILWVGLGAPKQEYWMAEHLGMLDVPVMIGIGAAFDFHAGIKRQAPRWMQQIGLEWIYRLACEPRRLWRRYLVNIPLFIYLSFLQLFGLKRFPLNPDNKNVIMTGGK